MAPLTVAECFYTGRVFLARSLGAFEAQTALYLETANYVFVLSGSAVEGGFLCVVIPSVVHS